MKRSEINQLQRDAAACFATHGWSLPPQPRWDVTDFGLGDWRRWGLVLVNLAEEPEYCEKLMYARKGMKTPAHCHRQKKEDIVARWGTLAVQVWEGHPSEASGSFELRVNGSPVHATAGQTIQLLAGERITLTPGIYHEFQPLTLECIIGEVSTANDDAHDNYFVDPAIGRFPEIEEDE